MGRGGLRQGAGRKPKLEELELKLLSNIYYDLVTNYHNTVFSKWALTALDGDYDRLWHVRGAIKKVAPSMSKDDNFEESIMKMTDLDSAYFYLTTQYAVSREQYLVCEAVIDSVAPYAFRHGPAPYVTGFKERLLQHTVEVFEIQTGIKTTTSQVRKSLKRFPFKNTV